MNWQDVAPGDMLMIYAREAPAGTDDAIHVAPFKNDTLFVYSVGMTHDNLVVINVLVNIARRTSLRKYHFPRRQMNRVFHVYRHGVPCP